MSHDTSTNHFPPRYCSILSHERNLILSPPTDDFATHMTQADISAHSPLKNTLK